MSALGYYWIFIFDRFQANITQKSSIVILFVRCVLLRIRRLDGIECCGRSAL